MKIEVAEFAGFCFGVKRAMDMAWNELENAKGDIYSLGQLIHNTQAVGKYKEKGLKVIDSVEGELSGSVIIRSHGVSLGVYNKLKEKEVNIVDATCPFVKKIQDIVYKSFSEGKEIVIVGNPKHPEVIGINGWCENSAKIVKTTEDIERYSWNKSRYCVVAQTTMNIDQYESIKKMLTDKVEDIEFYNTICLATKERQDASKLLSKKAQAMIVIGGYHSSNTQKLTEICSGNCPTFHVETKEELDINLISKYSVLGITAGASTPDWIIKEVIEYIQENSK